MRQQVPYDEFIFLLQHLRIDALHNALVETDVEALRMLLIHRLRTDGMTADGIIYIWSLKKVLMSADQLCLSRMQIHVILSIVHPNEHGEVDAEYFLRLACTVIPWMFDTRRFMEKAGMIAEEKAEAQKRAELQEMEAFTTGAMTARTRGAEGDQDVEELQQNAPDRDAVEKSLIHTANSHVQNHRQEGTLEVSKFLDAMHPDQVAQCQLQDYELRGFVAEAEIDHRNEVAYVDRIKRRPTAAASTSYPSSRRF